MRALMLGVVVGLSTPAAAQVLLESSDHDLVQMTFDRVAQPLTTLPPAIGARVVAVCLANGTGADKGMDNRAGAAPRHVALPGETACARWEPTGHTVYFFKRTADGWRAVLSYRLDLRDRDGLRLRFDWRLD